MFTVIGVLAKSVSQIKRLDPVLEEKKAQNVLLIYGAYCTY